MGRLAWAAAKLALFALVVKQFTQPRPKPRPARAAVKRRGHNLRRA
jgi:hypothetical protein